MGVAGITLLVHRHFPIVETHCLTCGRIAVIPSHHICSGYSRMQDTKLFEEREKSEILAPCPNLSERRLRIIDKCGFSPTLGLQLHSMHPITSGKVSVIFTEALSGQYV